MTLHIYGQRWQHDDIYIAGDRDSLEKLRELIDQALAHPGESLYDSEYTNDGDGYVITVRQLGSLTMERIRLPYSSQECSDSAAPLPWEIG